MKRKNPFDGKQKKKKKKVDNMHEEELREYRKAMRQGKTKPIRLICSQCGISRLVRTTTPEIYTDEVKKNNVCLSCMYDRRGNKIWTASGQKIEVKEED